MTYDSTADTLKHALRVADLVIQAATGLLDRAWQHDHSKTQDPELATFNEWTPKLKELVYGSDEYKAALEAMRPALVHHYGHNRHHPEFFEDGVAGMTLIDVMEMLADWKAATERTKSGDLGESLTIQEDRFKIDPQLAAILRNTAEAFGWLEGGIESASGNSASSEEG